MDAIKFVLSRIGEPHKHHRHCVHNLSYEEQLESRRRRGPGGRAWTNEEMEVLGLDRGIVVIGPEDWEIDVPDLDFSGLEALRRKVNDDGET